VLVHWAISFLGTGRQERTAPFPVSASTTHMQSMNQSDYSSRPDGDRPSLT
jgi:hypothetical protein